MRSTRIGQFKMDKKKIFIITVALLSIVSCTVVNKNITATEYNQTTNSVNCVEKLIAIINEYTKEINAVESVYDLFFISEKLYKDKMSFEKQNSQEISTLNRSLTEEEQAAYNEAIKNAMSEFEAAVNRKAKIFADEQEANKKK